MAIYKSSSSGIPFGLNAGRPANPGYGQLYSNGETSRLEIYTQASGWQNIVQETPGVASATGHYYQSDNYGTFIISGTNFVTGAIAYAVGTNGVEYQAQTTTYNSLVQLTTTFANLSGAYEPYDIKVVNPSNLFGLLPDAFYINESPIWATTAGALGSYITGQSVSIQLSATDAESNTLTYTVSSGSLPGGLSLSSSGLISGTTSGTTSQTFNFTVSASDGYNAAVTRSFSIAYTATPVVTGGTLSSDSTYYYRTFTGNGNLIVSTLPLTVDILSIAGGGGSSTHDNQDGGGGAGGAGGVLYSSSQNLSASTYSVNIGAGGGNRSNGVNTTFTGTGISLSAIGGGCGGSYNTVNAGSGGSGGGQAGAMTTSLASGTPGQGNSGGYGGQGSPAYGGGGGGGAGGAGGSTSNDSPGAGGSGTNTYSSWLTAISSAMTGVSGWSTATSGGYIGGGGGGGTRSASYAAAYAGGAGGAGGGGTGAGNQNSNTPSNGSTNTGGGAGGSSRNPNTAASGGSGLVIVRYTKASVGG